LQFKGLYSGHSGCCSDINIFPRLLKFITLYHKNLDFTRHYADQSVKNRK